MFGAQEFVESVKLWGYLGIVLMFTIPAIGVAARLTGGHK